MNKRDLRKLILGQLATELRMAVVIDGDLSDEDIERADTVQCELAREFERRAKGGSYSPEWDSAPDSTAAQSSTDQQG